MRLEDYFDFGDDTIRIKGHRIAIEHLLDLYTEGYSPEQIAQEFPGLSLEKIYASITYYLHNKVDIDAYIEHSREQAEREYQEWATHPSPLIERLRAVREQRSKLAS